MWDFTKWSSGEVALAKHILSDPEDEISNTTLLKWAGYYRLSTESAKSLCQQLSLAPITNGWNARKKNGTVLQVIKKYSPRFAILNGREDVAHTHLRLMQEAPKYDIPLDIFNLHDFTVRNDHLEGPVSLQDLWRYRAIFVSAPEPLASDAAPVDRFIYKIWELVETAGSPVIPSRQADWIARDKMEGTAYLWKSRIPSPLTLTTTSIAHALDFVHECRQRGRSVVLKPLGKGGGWGVTRIPIDWSDNQILDLLGKYKWWYGAGLLYMQEFVPNIGHDKRVLILGDITLGVEDRLAGTEGESWVYNISKGGKGLAGEITPEEHTLARHAAEACNQFFVGVDLLPGADHQSYVLEVNSNPGFSGFEQYVGVNVAASLLRYVALFGAPRGTMKCNMNE
ncbi:MAG: alpha-L-glutamate ligase [Promethearchaeota archaeon CR_4]|nr:MAG: alpha-L-glutamate ligase [Candidatus Lokiarchaeota archaeon CR_4]